MRMLYRQALRAYTGKSYTENEFNLIKDEKILHKLIPVQINRYTKDNSVKNLQVLPKFQ